MTLPDPQHTHPTSEVPGEVPSEVPGGTSWVRESGEVPGSLIFDRDLTGSPTGETPPHGVPSGVPTTNQTPTWTPEHESTRDAWHAAAANLRERQDRGLWSSPTIAETLAQRAGLDRGRAVDLIRSAIRHGYLEERPSPLGGKHQKQIRLASPLDGGAR